MNFLRIDLIFNSIIVIVESLNSNSNPIEFPFIKNFLITISEFLKENQIKSVLDKLPVILLMSSVIEKF